MTEHDKTSRSLTGTTDTTAMAAHEAGVSGSCDPVRTVDPAGANPPASESLEEPPSPCVSVCALDENDVCMGCYRTASEITDWFMATPAEKHAILRAAGERRRADSPIRLL
ncbi:MAG: DUF1289 domain-containing protein [Halieaceae bacterium]|nr:DUF1289 domain-containing protein [Halieaceae bacterium]